MYVERDNKEDTAGRSRGTEKKIRKDWERKIGMGGAWESRRKAAAKAAGTCRHSC